MRTWISFDFYLIPVPIVSVSFLKTTSSFSLFWRAKGPIGDEVGIEFPILFILVGGMGGGRN